MNDYTTKEEAIRIAEDNRKRRKEAERKNELAQQDMDRLEAENTRLRAALQRCADVCGPQSSGYAREVCETATAALAPQAVEAPREASGEAADEWRVCRKKPVVVHVRDAVPGEEVFTREGLTTAKDDDLVMRGVDGEVYPIGRDIFERTYDVVEPAAPREDAPAPVQTFAVGQRVRIDCRDSPGFGTVLKDWGDDSYNVQHDDYPNHMRYGWSVLATPAAPPATRDEFVLDRRRGVRTVAQEAAYELRCMANEEGDPEHNRSKMCAWMTRVARDLDGADEVTLARRIRAALDVPVPGDGVTPRERVERIIAPLLGAAGDSAPVDGGGK